MQQKIEIFNQIDWYDIPIETMHFDFEKNQINLAFSFPIEQKYEKLSVSLVNIVQFQSQISPDLPLKVVGVYEANAYLENNEIHLRFVLQIGENCLPLWEINIKCKEIIFSENYPRIIENFSLAKSEYPRL